MFNRITTPGFYPAEPSAQNVIFSQITDMHLYYQLKIISCTHQQLSMYSKKKLDVSGSTELIVLTLEDS